MSERQLFQFNFALVYDKIQLIATSQFKRL
jgi:hypothetical protein